MIKEILKRLIYAVIPAILAAILCSLWTYDNFGGGFDLFIGTYLPYQSAIITVSFVLSLMAFCNDIEKIANNPLLSAFFFTAFPGMFMWIGVFGMLDLNGSFKDHVQLGLPFVIYSGMLIFQYFRFRAWYGRFRSSGPGLTE